MLYLLFTLYCFITIVCYIKICYAREFALTIVLYDENLLYVEFESHVPYIESSLHARIYLIYQFVVCLPSLKKRLEPSLSCRSLEYATNWRNLIGWFRRLKTKEH